MPIKVTVCFDSVRVTVPCGEGNFPVKELINKAIHRYKRAVSKGSNHWVEVTTLKTVSGGGILDPDDLLCDVVDDREQLVAEFEEHEGMSAQHIGGDGASASSTGTASPDFFTSDNINDKLSNGTSSNFMLANQNKSISNNAATDILVTSEDFPSGSKLKVRRGSAPDLNLENELSQITTNKTLMPRRESVQESDEPHSESSDEDKRSMIYMHSSLDRKKTGRNHFTRDALRASLSNHLERHYWQEEQNKQLEASKKSQIQERIGLLEGHDGHEVKVSNYSDSSTVCLHNDGGPLGIHAVPAFDENGKNMGLLIQSIEPDRPVYNDGRIKSGDIVTEINGISLQDVPFQRAQEIFRAAKDTKEIFLKVVHQKFSTLPYLNVLPGKQSLGGQPPPVMPKPRSHTPLRPSPLTMPTSMEQNTNNATSLPPDSSAANNAQNKGTFGNNRNFSITNIVNKTITDESKNVTVERATESNNSNKKVPPKVPVRSITTLLTGLMGDVPLNAITNTKKIGKKIVINLVKGATGLGFSVTSRDNQTDGNCPIYIRNILPKGAAVQDGQLRPGDRLLQVNGIEMTGKTQSDAVQILRMIPEGSPVEIVISRQEEVDEKFKVPRKMTDSKNGNSYVDGDKAICHDDDKANRVDDGPPDLSPLQPVQSEDALDSSMVHKEKITLHIPLNETGSAGLGVSVKGKTETFESSSRDLGIFVKTVLQGGAAYKDGHLQVNDQLLEVNGVKLEGLSNSSAMEALRLAMIQDGLIPGIISLTVARPTGKPEVSPRSSKSDGSGQFQYQSDSEVGTILLNQQSSDKLSSRDYDKDKSELSLDRLTRFSDSGQDVNSESHSNGYQNIFPGDNVAVSPFKTKPVIKPFKGNLSESKMLTFQGKELRPHSTIGFIHENEKHSDCNDESQMNFSPDDSDINFKPLMPFEREGLGRQSMSEKRKGHLDPRTTEIYKIVKANKENKGISHLEELQHKDPVGKGNTTSEKPFQIVLGPNQKEILHHQAQTNPPKITQDAVYQNENSWNNQHFGRGRACNESFRAAVDRSYDIQDPALMDTLEEESVESSANTIDPSLSGRSSISSEMTEDNSSLQRLKLKEKEKKGNLLKGFLRFGKGRKSQDEISHRSRSEERSTTRTVNSNDISKSIPRENRIVALNLKPVQSIDFIPISESPSKPMQPSNNKSRYETEYLETKGHYRSQSVEPSNRISSHFSPIHHPLSSSVPKQTWEYKTSPNEQKPITDPRYLHPAAMAHSSRITGNHYEGHSPYFIERVTSSETLSSDSDAFMSRAEYIQQLRSLYQHHHRQRQGVYPREDTDEFYEKQLQEIEQNVGSDSLSEEDMQTQFPLTTNQRFGNKNDGYNSYLYSRNLLRNSKDSMNYPSYDLHTYREAPDRTSNTSAPDRYNKTAGPHRYSQTAGLDRYSQTAGPDRYSNTASRTQQSLHYSYSDMADDPAYRGQNLKPKMTYYSQTSPYMFNKSTPPFADLNSAKV